MRGGMKNKVQESHSLVLSLTTTRRRQRVKPGQSRTCHRSIAASFQAGAPDFDIQNPHKTNQVGAEEGGLCG